jgi:hypothetical protein
MDELPVKRPIFSVVVEAHRRRFNVVGSIRRGDRIAVCRVLLCRFPGAISIFNYIRRGPGHRGRDCRQAEPCVFGGLGRFNQLADGHFADAQPLRDRTVAHPLALQYREDAQIARRSADVRALFGQTPGPRQSAG